VKSAAKAYHDELKALFTKVIEHHRNGDFDLWPSVVDRLRERLSKRAEKLVELQMAAEDAELEWEDERRQEKVRRWCGEYSLGSALQPARPRAPWDQPQFSCVGRPRDQEAGQLQDVEEESSRALKRRVPCQKEFIQHSSRQAKTRWDGTARAHQISQHARRWQAAEVKFVPFIIELMKLDMLFAAWAEICNGYCITGSARL